MKTEDRMLIAIRSRKDLEPAKISLRKLLASGGMEHYLNLCSDRLAEHEMIDGEDTTFNFVDFPDVFFTTDGFFNCRHILENYLPFDTLADAWQLLIKAEQKNKEINHMAADFRKMKWRNLLKYYAKWNLHKTNENTEQEAKQLVLQWMAMEMWSRTFFAGIWRKSKEALTHIYVSWKYRGLFNIIRDTAAKYN